MKRNKPLILAILLTIGLCKTSFALAVAEPSPASEPERYSMLRELEGTVRDVDLNQGTLLVEDRNGQHLGLHVDEFTTLAKTNDNGVTLGEFKPGDPVHVYYTAWNNRAQHVDRLQTFTRTILGAP
jgi:hypothetical protein